MSFLADLPSSGNFVANTSNPKSDISNYVCTHETKAPSNQYITSDGMNPLVRSLRRRQQEKQNLKRSREPQPTNQTKKRRLEQ
mmetsp:Transcript_90628/g.135812  ORF Transcript_90628/g.135812 Transcript_90628/m.135812 type:complete len:83 (-) Transcript_90628:225-473(-)